MSRRALGGAVLMMAAAAAVRPRTAAASADALGAIGSMAAGLQSAAALSFTAEMSFGASVAKDRLQTLGPRARVMFRRPGDLFAIYGEGGPDIHLLVSGGEATLFRPSLAAKASVKLGQDGGSAFDVPGLFLPYMGLLAADVAKVMFGTVQSVTPIAEGLPDQPETTVLSAIMSDRFTGEIWLNKGNGRPARVIGTYFDGKRGAAASAAVSYSDWSTEALPDTAFDVKALSAVKTVSLAELGL